MRSGRKATSPQADVVFNESHSDEEAINTTSDADGEDEEKQGQDTNLQRLPFDSDNEESGNKANEVREDYLEEKGHDGVEQHEVVSGDTGDVNKGSTVDNDCVSSVTNLEKLKNLLQDEVQPETPKAETTQVDDSSHGQEPSAAAGANESENLENYFQELEDDMFGWESDEADKNASDSDTEGCREKMNEKSLSEGKEESHLSVEENRTEEVGESIDANANDVTMPGQVDSPQVEDSHSSDDKHEPSETDQSSEAGVDAQRVNEKEEVIHPRDDKKTLKTNESDSSPEEQCTDEQKTKLNTNEEEEEDEVQETKDLETREKPAEQTFDEANCGDQGNAQIPKLPLFAGEEGNNRNKPDDGITIPPTDEVRKQLKDVLVDVRFFLGMYIIRRDFDHEFNQLFIIIRVSLGLHQGNIGRTDTCVVTGPFAVF